MGKQCRRCLAKNYFEAMCRSRKKHSVQTRRQKVHPLADSNSDGEEVYSVGTIKPEVNSVNKGWFQTLEVEDDKKPHKKTFS